MDINILVDLAASFSLRVFVLSLVLAKQAHSLKKRLLHPQQKLNPTIG
jgi:hypothetical protein